ncbi:F-box protein At5g07670-like [Salvia miltiorrhiza]|uniref:F-box protein At5g07670-like n=1 Tax=Salvia miltiorrhiza TaxID=226208 RepID=UPI0025ACA30C|nr:F-box protein At5g07670-like [Salvia miltiorrhiza]
MGFSPDKENQHSASWLRSKKALNNVLCAMRLNKPLTPKNQIQPPLASPRTPKIHHFTPTTDVVLDKTSLLSDEILLKILSKLPTSQRDANFLVSKRWLNLQGRLVRSVKLLDWYFLVSGRLLYRFPNLVRVDLVTGCLVSPQNLGVSVTNRIVSFHGGSDCFHHKDWFTPENYALSGDEVDRGLKVLAGGFPNLRKLAVMNATEMGLLSVAEECPALQELELRMCNDRVLRGIAACQNLQILRLSGVADGSLVSDVGLTILAQGCKKLMKLELSGCGGSFEGIRAIGQCCLMLQELTLSDHDMEDGWMLGLSFCENLKSLRLVSCRRIDGVLDEDLGCCPAIESLHLDKCQLRDKKSLRALFLISQNAREVVLQNCWGLSDDMFITATALRRVSSLSIQGCSLLSTHGLESVIISWDELKSLKVISCNNIKDEEINPLLSNVFAALKDLKWEPDSRSRLSSSLAGTGVGRKGAKFFNKSCDWKSLPASFRTKLDAST